MRKNLLKEALVVGAATALVAHGLQAAYKATDFYPPNTIFYFAIGAGVHVLFEVTGGNRWYVENVSPRAMPSGFLA